MKHLSTLFFFSIFIFAATAQVAPPEAINYSGVARDSNGGAIVNSNIGLQLSVLQTSATGTMVYQENHTALTDEFGRFSVALGFGTAQSGSFSAIDWGSDSHFLQTGLDPAGGTAFQLMGTTQMLSVPYAFHSKTSNISIQDNDTSATNEIQSLSLSGDTLYISEGNYVVLGGLGQAPDLPTVITNPATDIGIYTAVLSGEITDLNGTTVISRGIVYDTIPSPTTVVNYGDMELGAGLGSFGDTAGIGFIYDYLTINSTYYVRAYAITSENDIAYGNEVSFNTQPTTAVPGSGMVDGDGNTYPSLIFGNGQEWTTENLRTSKYADGTDIPNVSDNFTWENLTSGAYCWYDNDSSHDWDHGKLYNHYAVEHPSNLCGTGWHVPTKTEFEDLFEQWGGYPIQAAVSLATDDASYWDSQLPPGAVNASGLSILPSGFRAGGAVGPFVSMESHGILKIQEPEEWVEISLNSVHFAPQFASELYFGASVRCIKD